MTACRRDISSWAFSGSFSWAISPQSLRTRSLLYTKALPQTGHFRTGAIPPEYRKLCMASIACSAHPICHNLPMCGRYRLSRRKQLVEEYFYTESDEPEWTPRYNIAPSQPVPVIRQNPKEPRRGLSLMRWGLIPSWAKDA